MGKINDQVKIAFDAYKQNGNLLQLVRKLVFDADYSVRYAWQLADVRDAINEHCPASIFECVFYDGENGEYHLFDFDPNGLSDESIQIEVRSRLQHEYHIDPHDVDRFMDSVYLINTETMRKVVTG